MDRIDFMPEDYIQRKESHRANFFYMMIVGLIGAAVLSTFGAIKIRQRAIAQEVKAVDKRMMAMQQAIVQLESLQKERQEMMKTALLSAELIEPMPRSIVLALLTNALPEGVSLTRVQIMQSKPQQAGSNQYEAAKKMAAEQKLQRQEYMTTIEIEGLAASDIGVADYIASLSNSTLLENVCLVHSMQKEIDNTSYRQFKLTAEVRGNVTITNETVEKIGKFQPINSGI